MSLLLTGRSDSYAQFIAVLVIFVAVLGVTAWVTRWIANYQKQQSANYNIEVIETTRIANNKYIQIIRIGDTYKVIAVCKETVTMLGDVSKEQLKTRILPQQDLKFKEFFEHAMKKDSSKESKPKE